MTMKFIKKYRTVLIIIGVAVSALIVISIVKSAGQPAGSSQFQTVAAQRGTLSATVGATGTVRANQSAILNWQSTGTVEDVCVKVGDLVTADQELASLTSTSLPQNVILARADLVAAQRNLDDTLRSETAKMQAQQVLVQAQKAVEDAQKKVYATKYPRASQALIDNTEARIKLAQRQLAKTSDAYRHAKRLPDSNPDKAEAEMNMTNAMIQLNQLKANLNYYTGKPDELDIAEANANLALAMSRLADAQRDFERLKNGPAADDIDAARARVEAAQATINMGIIIAPFAGTITQAGSKSGDLVAPGDTAFRLDDLSHLLVDVQVSEVDINNIKIGQSVKLTFDAILGKEYKGIVAEVGQAGNTVQGVVNFTATVELSDADTQVKPGMTAAVTILVKQLNDVLLVPNRAVRLLDGDRVVYILKNGIPQPVKIQLGASSDTDSEVIDGTLKVGDLIVLNPPTVFGPNGGGGAQGGG
jgi:HlyD family secretion protein